MTTSKTQHCVRARVALQVGGEPKEIQLEHLPHQGDMVWDGADDYQVRYLIHHVGDPVVTLVCDRYTTSSER